MAIEMLSRGGYGQDKVPDFFFLNFKMTDLVGHQWGIESAEMGDVVKAQDDALAALLDYMDREVDDFVVVVTADHGHSRTATSSGAWPISKEELASDINNHFGVPANQSLVEASVAYGFFLNLSLMKRLDINTNEIAQFAADQTIRDNWGGASLPEDYEDRAHERVFTAAFPSNRLPAIMRCSFGNDRWRDL
jgi:alkaline phosphatase